jgi:uncharacterized protein
MSEVPRELVQMLVGEAELPFRHEAADIARSTVMIPVRDGIQLATELYLPPGGNAPTVVQRTPYDRNLIEDSFVALSRCGYAVVAQDCRGTGDSEPDHWDYYVYEREDGFDCVEWITQQEWYDGFIGSLGGSYVASTQWAMAMHPAMTAIAPEVGGLGLAPNTRPRLHLFVDAYARSVGKGADKVAVPMNQMEALMLDETLAGGYFNEPLRRPLPETLVGRFPELRSLSQSEGQRRLWEAYSAMPPAQRAGLVKDALGHDHVTTVSVEALPAIFGNRITHDQHVVPSADPLELVRSVRPAVLMISAWYDWCLDDQLVTWDALMRHGDEGVRERSRLLIPPSTHNMPGYHEGREQHPELDRKYRVETILPLLERWYRSVRDDDLDSWPKVVYYLMGANEWRSASEWPPAQSEGREVYLRAGGALSAEPPAEPEDPDAYVYDPDDPTPTLGGSIVSYVITPGSVDVREAQARPDVVTYTTDVLEQDLDVVGPLRAVLYASSDAVDTDFAARLTDVFPDGRAVQLQAVVLRTRYRDPNSDAKLLEPGRIYGFEIDLWATANRFKAGHRLRLDISSADFPKFDRHSNRAGDGDPVPAEQTIHHDPDHPSHLVLTVLP